MLNIICFFLILTSSCLYAMEEKDLFPSSPDKYIPASIWHNSKGELCVMWGSNIIIVDQWHYAEFQNQEDLN